MYKITITEIIEKEDSRGDLLETMKVIYEQTMRELDINQVIITANKPLIGIEPKEVK